MRLTARFHGRCAETGRPIRPGDEIEHDKANRRSVLLTPARPERTPPDGGYDAWARRASRGTPTSSAVVIGDRVFYRNRKGRCIDAPCCGCCTI